MKLKHNLEHEVTNQTSEIIIRKEALIKKNEIAIQKEKQVVEILNGLENAILLAV
jgi:hypothetical protein